jgi:hypothetical protein
MRIGERLGVRTKLVALAIVAAAIGTAAATLASGSHSRPAARARSAPVVMGVVPSARPLHAPRQHVFRPPVVRVRAAAALPPTGFGLGPVVAVALAVVAAGLLFRRLAAEL